MSDDRCMLRAKTNDDEDVIDRLVADFFSVFSNKGGQLPDVRRLRSLMVEGAVIIKQAAPVAEVYSLEEFIMPRQKMLSDGSLTDFEERETSARTDIVGGIARRACIYQKSGELKGERFETRGAKFLHLVKVRDEWRISAVIWEDEREGLVLPETVDELIAEKMA